MKDKTNEELKLIVDNSGWARLNYELKNDIENEINLNAQDLSTETEGCIERVEVDGDAKPVPCRVIVAPPCMPTKSGAAEFRTIATVTWLADAVLGFARP